MSKEKTWIERAYKGVEYRSTLEARWAFIFDNLTRTDRRTSVLYEDDAHYLSDGLTYTPDFHIKNAVIDGKKEPDVWFEVKGDVNDLNGGLDEKLRLFAENVGPIIVVFRLPFGGDVRDFKNAISGIHSKYFAPVGVYSTKYLTGVEGYGRNNFAMPCVLSDGAFAVTKWDAENIDWNATADIYHAGAMQWRTKNGNAGERQEVVNE